MPSKKNTALNHLGNHLRQLRQSGGLTQEQFAARTLPGGVGVVSAPTYIKYENGQRQPSDKVLRNLVTIHVRLKTISADAPQRARATQYLLALKYMDHPSEFVRELATQRLGSLTK